MTDDTLVLERSIGQVRKEWLKPIAVYRIFAQLDESLAPVCVDEDENRLAVCFHRGLCMYFDYYDSCHMWGEEMLVRVWE